jgi:hypothetical protein
MIQLLKHPTLGNQRDVLNLTAAPRLYGRLFEIGQE